MYWKISDFTEAIKNAVGDQKLNRKTVSTWFNKLEREKIHYINRTEDTNEKVYDEMDLQIGVFIKQKRNENWSLNAIFNEIRDDFETRPSPIEQEVLPATPVTIDYQHEDSIEQDHIMNQLKREILDEIIGAYEEVAATQLEEMKHLYEILTQKLELTDDVEDDREKRFQDIVLRRRVEYQLEKEALLIWSSKPTEERFKKIGWFRKEEDITKRDLFMKDYVNRHFAEKIRKEIFYEEKQKNLETEKENNTGETDVQ